MKRMAFWPGAVMVLTVAAVAWASGPVGRLQRSKVAAAEKVVADGDEQVNLLALHDPQAAEYDGDCLKCHSDILQETSKDPRILPFHQAMMPFTPGYNPAHGPNNGVCVQCHRFVDLRMDSAGALRKQVNPELCAMCHGPSGPGPVYYER